MVNEISECETVSEVWAPLRGGIKVVKVLSKPYIKYYWWCVEVAVDYYGEHRLAVVNYWDDVEECSEITEGFEFPDNYEINLSDDNILEIYYFKC